MERSLEEFLNHRLRFLETEVNELEHRMRKVEISIAKGYVVAGSVAALGSAIVSWLFTKL